MGADFKVVGEAALAVAPQLLHQWLGGKRQGHEWVGERRANGGMGDSWSVNLNTGCWGAFATGQKGGDLVSLYAALNHLDQVAALTQVAAQVGANTPGVPVLARTRIAPIEYPAERIPEDAPPMLPHFKYGEASAVYRYGHAFVVCRHDLPEGGKQFSQFTWRNGKWAARGYPDPRPLYRVHQLIQRPTAPVLIVEGEKCADAARACLKAYAVLTWAGGAGAVKKNDWSPLTGRDVLIWPDADEPGAQAAASVAELLLPLAARVRVLVPSDRPAGWDVADAIAAGWTAAHIIGWAKTHIRTVSVADIVPVPEPTPAVAVPPPEDSGSTDPQFWTESSVPAAAEPATVEYLSASTDDGSAVVNWISLGLETNQGGIPHPTLANASKILQMHPDYRGRIWFDSFQQRLWHTLRGAQCEWTDADAADMTVRIQQQLHLPKFSLALVQEAVSHAARVFTRNSLTDWLGSLVWDGVKRLDHWLNDTLGVDLSPYSIAVANNFPLSMVARAFKPGCQVDTMPVLEGKMGRGKTSFLAMLGGEWYDAITTAFGEKDFLQGIQGLWLAEIPDMTGFGKREHSQILATITIRNDRYRAAYGVRTENHPRGCIFAATSETDDYLQDTRGRRRFWPLRCQSIDLDSLHAQRDQIFAEAVKLYRSGADWYHMPEETDDEQLQRAAPDLWTDRVLNFAQTMYESEMPISASRVLHDIIEMPYAQQDHAAKHRISSILRADGWIPSTKKNARCWVKPKRVEIPDS